MHDLAPLTALGSTEPRHEDIGGLAIREITDVALASVAARLHEEADCRTALAQMLGQTPPAPGHATTGAETGAIWTGPDQWMVYGPYTGPHVLADRIKSALGACASVTDQTDGWACFDLSGDARVIDMFERLCPVPARQMQAGDAQRSTIHHMGCLVICTDAGRSFRVLGARSSAGSLHHALVTAARSVA